MNKSRLIGVIMAMATATIGMTTATVTAPANAAPRGPEPVSTWLRPVRAQVDTWINIAWRSRERVCDASVRYYGQDVDVEYRGHRRSATFSRGVTLFPGRVDYTTIQVNPDTSRTGLTRLRAVISYDSCGWKARPQTRWFTLTLPVQRNNRPGWPGDDDGRPGDGNNGRPGDNNGWPNGNNGRPNDNNNGRPGDNNGWPNDNNGHHSPKPSASATTSAPATTTSSAPATTTSSASTSASAAASTSASATSPSTLPSSRPPVRGGQQDGHGHQGQQQGGDQSGGQRRNG
jgi:hypothetical protein